MTNTKNTAKSKSDNKNAGKYNPDSLFASLDHKAIYEENSNNVKIKGERKSWDDLSEQEQSVIKGANFAFAKAYEDMHDIIGFYTIVVLKMHDELPNMSDESDETEKSASGGDW